MITRRQVIIGAGCLAIAAGALPLALTHASPPPAPAHRELRLHLADGLRRQVWTDRSHSWDERADIIQLRSGETIDLTLVNDTRDAVEIAPAGPFPGAALRPGETKSVQLHVVDLQPFELQSISHGEGLTQACSRQLRRFEVRTA